LRTEADEPDEPPDVAGFTLPTRHHPPPEIRELPEPPREKWRIIGPALVLSGAGLASGEFVLWPYIAARAGLVFLWGAVLGVTLQWFLNMEIERYTLATGETALTGFSRLWRHWGLFFAVLVCFANLWPGWATSSAAMVTYLFGGAVMPIAVALMIAIGALLTLAPVVYVALERLMVLKLAAVAGFFLLAMALAVGAPTWRELGTSVTHAARVPWELGFPLLMGAIAFAGAGGGQNLCQSNWIRDKGFGMGAHLRKLVSPVTGHEEVTAATGACVFVADARGLERWSRWWRFANLEQALTFAGVTALTIVLTSMLAHATLHGRPGLPNSIAFLKLEGEQLQAAVGGWFGRLFWAIGAYSLFAAAAGIVDYTSRLAADVLKSTYLRARPVTESQLYFALVWALVAVGCTILLAGVDQPLVLLLISACTGGAMMFVYSILLVVLNRRTLPAALRPPGYRVAALLAAAAFFGVLTVLTVGQQVKVYSAR
jgi:hypothetical protein